MSVKIEMFLPALPKGYEYTGEYREVNSGEWLLLNNECVRWARESPTTEKYHIIKKCEWWKNIPEHGILCWVSDGNKENTRLDIVLNHCCDGHYPFKTQKNVYKYARPVMGEEITKYLIENN